MQPSKLQKNHHAYAKVPEENTAFHGLLRIKCRGLTELWNSHHKQQSMKRKGDHCFPVEGEASERGILHKNMKCSPELKTSLHENTIETLNSMLSALQGGRDLGIVIEFRNRGDLHTALGLPHSPISQGDDESQSFLAFRNWLIQKAAAITPGCHLNQDDSRDSLAFYHLSDAQSNAITYLHWQILPWAVEVQAHQPPLQMPLVLSIVGRGMKRANVFVVRQVFGSI